MGSQRVARVLVLGEGPDEEGEDYFDHPVPGHPINEDHLGAVHVLVQRSLVELAGIACQIVAPPRLRTRRRAGNPGLIADLVGEPRPGSSRSHIPWLKLCVGNNGVDLAVLVKDAGRPGDEERVRNEIRASFRSHPALEVIEAAATPSIEGWVLGLSETEGLNEREAKVLWDRNYSGGPAVMAGVARNIDLRALSIASPNGYSLMLERLLDWAARWGG